MIVLLDSLFRFAAVGILMLGLVVIARAAIQARAAQLAMAFTSSVAAHLLYSSPAVAPFLGPLDLPVRALSVAAPALLWLTALAMFADEFELRPAHLVPLLLIEAASFAARYTTGVEPGISRAVGYAYHAGVLLLYGSAVWIAWKGYPADLIEMRRQFRVWFIACASLLGVAIAIAELFLWGTSAPEWLELLKVAAIAALATVLLSWIVEVRPVWFSAIAAVPKPLSRPGDVPAAERLVLDALRKAMEEGSAYRKDGLTIAALAEQLRTPEHLLRKVINQRLGHRNFNAFLNQYRIAEVKQALADPSKARLPVLTLALEAGFASIGPFNRAFKDALGMTPTEFRRSRQPAEPEIRAPIPKSATNTGT